MAEPFPALYLSHGAPPLVDDGLWVSQLAAWALELPRPAEVLVVRAPTIEHWSPLFVALGASADPGQAPRQVIDGYWMGLAKRSIQLV